MDKKNITTIKEDLTDYFYVLAQVHSKEIRKLYEFDDDKLQFTLELETYERERTNDQGAVAGSPSRMCGN